MVMFVLIFLFGSSACLTLTPGSPPSTPASPTGASTQGVPAVTAVGKVVFGPGAFNFPDTKAGLADLTSYKSTLILSFDGTRAGKTEQWSKTYVMLTAKEPASHQSTIEKTGDISDPNPVFMAEINGAAYEQHGANVCNATVIDPENLLTEKWEPAGFLTGVIGAEVAGTETVNDVPANHYTFDERAFGQLGIAKSTGEMWVASKTGYIVKYVLTTKGGATYFGEGIEGTLIWDYQLTNINQAVTFKLPGDCPAGMVNAPLLPDASGILSMPGILAYATTSSLADAAAFYQKQIPSLGWELVGEPTITDTTALLDYIQGEQTMTIIITTGDDGTNVHVVLGNSQGTVPSP